jgi:hypothetical protein
VADEPTAAAAAPASAPSSSAPASPAPQATPETPAASSAPPTPSTPASPAPSATAAPAADKPARPDWAPESYWDPEKSAVKPEFADHYKELATFKATEDSRKLTLPATANDYPLELPTDFKVPQGLEFKIDPNNPIWSQAREFAHKSGMSADQFKQMTALYAGAQIGNEQMLKGARDAEVAKLGPAGTARVTAVESFFEAQLGSDLAKVMSTMLVTAKHVEGFEKIMAAFRNQGAGSFSQSGRSPNEATKVSPEAYAKMTYSQQKEYTAQFANPPANGRAN